LGITGIQDFGLVYNLNQTGSSADPTLSAETVTFYNSAGGTVATFTLTAPFTAPPFDNGNGGSGYLEQFSWSAAEATAIATLFSTCPTCLVGKSATITGANDGADSFFVFDRDGTIPDTRPVPEPASMLLLGTGLVAIARVSRRRKASK
jgi:hypothetical protein